jgi:hypothetical protein
METSLSLLTSTMYTIMIIETPRHIPPLESRLHGIPHTGKNPQFIAMQYMD